jgi:Gly-Xaa carboxypeptidase
MPLSNEKKEGILPSTNPQEAPDAERQAAVEKLKAKYRSRPKFILFLITYLGVHFVYEAYKWVEAVGIGDNAPRCAQADVLTPDKNANLWNELNEKIGTPAFETSAINWLADAVRIPSVNLSSSLGFLL